MATISGIGHVTHLVEDRGFGFIRPDGSDDAKDVFFHVSGLAAGLEFSGALLEMRVVYEIQETSQGQRAKDVRPAN